MTKISISTRPPCERRFRCGMAFGPEPREVEVDDQQFKALKADPLLRVEKPKEAKETGKTGEAKAPKDSGKPAGDAKPDTPGTPDTPGADSKA